MDDEAIGIVLWIVIGVGGLVLALGVAGGIMYAADTTVGADVIDTNCAGGGGGSGGLFGVAQASSQVTVKTKFPVPGVEHTMQDFDDDTCQLLHSLRMSGKDPFAEYSIRSGHTVLYRTEGGECLYDNQATPPTAC